ncbi:MAG: polysaccharide deacetylase [Gemmatimonadota bacterium]|nr:polysaccharide deacetylase [Gemmatimonadota bacterium]
MLPSHNRFRYSGIDTRPQYTWPGGKRLALYVALNVEHFPFGVAGGIDLDRETKPWSQRSWLWREYGNRVGGWRLARLFDDLGMNVGVIANAANYQHCPELIARYRDRGDEMIGHGISNGTERPIDMAEATERKMVEDVTALMTAADGMRPAGWLSPYLTPSLVTTDLLIENDYDYVLDWGTCDEQPFWVKGTGGTILSVPYPIELNDQPAIVGRRCTGEEYAGMLVDQFDEMLRQSEDAPLVFGISLHTFIVGQPFRIVQLRRAFKHMLGYRDRIWVTVPREIARYYRTLPMEVQLHAE